MLALAHLLGGVLLIATAYVTSFVPIFVLLFLYCNLYMPTMALSNSITFRSLGAEKQSYFPGIRLWGTIGWIAAGLSFSAYLDYQHLGFYQSFFDVLGQHDAFVRFLGWWQGHVVPVLKPLFAVPWIGGRVPRLPPDRRGRLNLLRAVLSDLAAHPAGPLEGDRSN